jgi:glycosyltransferase involved in cell wall biosynthesis
MKNIITVKMGILLKKMETINLPSLSFLIVDNGSSESLQIDEPLNDLGQINFVRTPSNLGFGGGIMFGIAHATTEYVGWMPGNLKVDPGEVAVMISKIVLDPNLVVKASRSGRKLSPRFKTFFAGSIQSLLLKTNMLDSGGTPTFCSRKFIVDLRNPPNDYVFESFILYQARKAKMKIVRPKVIYGTRVFGQSHWQRGLRSEVLLLKRIFEESKTWIKSANYEK